MQTLRAPIAWHRLAICERGIALSAALGPQQDIAQILGSATTVRSGFSQFCMPCAPTTVDAPHARADVGLRLRGPYLMPSVFENPSKEMLGFASAHGGPAYSGKYAPTADRNLAHEYLDMLAECYAESKNAEGEAFSIDAHISASGVRNARFTKRNGRLLILYDEGLMRMIDEVALLCVIARFRDFRGLQLADHFHLLGQAAWRGVGFLEHYDTGRIKSLVKNLGLGREHIDFANVLTNLVLLFVLAHEFSHAVKGHCILLDADNPLSFLGESESHATRGPDKWSLIAEMSADYLSLQHLLSVCGKDPFKIDDEITEAAKMPCVIASLFMLFSYWFTEGMERSGQSLYGSGPKKIDLTKGWSETHPVSTDRITLLLSSLYDFQFAKRFGFSKLAEWADEALALIVDKLPSMPESSAVRIIESQKSFHLDRAFRQKRYLAESILGDFQEKSRPFVFLSGKSFQWE